MNTNNSKTYEIQYNQFLINNKTKLIKELEEIEKELNNQQQNCDHVAVCLGFKGFFQYKDTRKCECLFCRESNPKTKYPIIDASYYKEEIYGRGELSFQRDERLNELQNIAMELYNDNLELTTEELVTNMNIIVKENINTCKKSEETVKKIKR